MIATLLAKYMAPVLIGAVLATGGIIGIQKLTKQQIVVKAECPKQECNCPDVQSIDMDKVKNFKGTLKLEQHYHNQINGDSVLVANLVKEIEAKLIQLKLARCK